ncbi:GT2 family glycosyltransferase [Sphingomonas sp. PP-F2F-G114-C0414]|uniref:glycosyltransferase n=1 Tax=Sphingomonas sp. PP-F2F-G114-C0414 TaxID=2135662 RepID=UPI000EF86FDF|nr:glycosyltransferase [Sphingomonas sp. PP-F2F-G114-C0414]RMB25753.1 GT2 family glycosyltransferase [Sphingomonas sp. PP-F2F-G114-C0414]
MTDVGLRLRAPYFISLAARTIGLGRHRRTPRRLGDAARAIGDWAEAAKQYGQHVARSPDDVAIVVQWGHALKHSGRLVDALAAYRQGLSLTPDDADLWLSMGHVRKLLGDRPGALNDYRRSAALDGNRHALIEADLLQDTGDGAERPAPAERAAIITALSPRTSNVEILDITDLRLAGQDRLDLISRSAQMLLDLKHNNDPEFELGVLTLDTQPLDVAYRPRGEVQIDYGAGFDDNLALVYTAGREPTRILVARPGHIVGVRWILDRKPNAMRLPLIGFAPITLTEAEEMLRARGPDDLDIDRLVALVQRCARVEITAEEAAEATLSLMAPDPHVGSDYRSWISTYERPQATDYVTIARMTETMAWRPRFSFVLPVYNTPAALLCACLDSLLAQTYTDFEICIADDHSSDPQVATILADYASRDIRVKSMRCATNGHISAASNSALTLATGDFVVLVDHDDLIPDYALFVVAFYINQHPNADVLFSDEDKVDLRTMRSAPYFKGRWNRFLMYGHNMISHLGVYRRALIESVGGFRIGFEGSQDYDLFLRCYESSADDRIIHIPHILYHWRMIPGSTSVSPDQKSYAAVAAQRAINAHFERTGLPLRSVPSFIDGLSGVVPAVSLNTLISIVIPTRDGLDILKICIDSILATSPINIEIIIIDNGSEERSTLNYLAKLESAGTARIIRDDKPFNFSRINNLAVEYARGEILGFINNDTEVLARDWLDRVRALLSMKDVGIVGARLLYPDRTLQHFGLVLGMGHHRVAGTPHNGIGGEDPGYFAKARLLQEFSAVTAACLFIRKTEFLEVGGFDPELEIAYNDVDLCLKIRELGFKVIADPEILLIHKESKTRGSDENGARAKRLEAEAALMRTRWATILDDDPYYSPNLTLAQSDFTMATPPRTPLPWQN